MDNIIKRTKEIVQEEISTCATFLIYVPNVPSITSITDNNKKHRVEIILRAIFRSAQYNLRFQQFCSDFEIYKCFFNPLLHENKYIGAFYIDIKEPINNEGKIKYVGKILAKIIDSQNLKLEKKLFDVEMQEKIKEEGGLIFPTMATETEIVGTSPEMLAVFDKIYIYKETKLPLLIEGESGVGKENTAKAIHYMSSRKEKPFISVNCSTLLSGDPKLAYVELFGCIMNVIPSMPERKGFFEQANGGTLFLDEICSLASVDKKALDIQAMLLRVVQDQVILPLGSQITYQVDAKLIVAASKSIEKLVEEGLFLNTLYNRLAYHRIKIPSLRDRGKEDLFAIAHYFLNILNMENNVHISFTFECKDIIASYHFDGNIRELQRLILLAWERALIKGVIDEELLLNSAKELHLKQKHEKRDSLIEDFAYKVIEHKIGIDQLEEMMIKIALKTSVNKQKAADLLNINRNALDRKIEKYQIDWKNLL